MKTIPEDNETIKEVEQRIKTLYAALIRAELKAHKMREQKKIVQPESISESSEQSA